MNSFRDAWTGFSRLQVKPVRILIVLSSAVTVGLLLDWLREERVFFQREVPTIELRVSIGLLF